MLALLQQPLDRHILRESVAVEHVGLLDLGRKDQADIQEEDEEDQVAQHIVMHAVEAAHLGEPTDQPHSGQEGQGVVEGEHERNEAARVRKDRS